MTSIARLRRGKRLVGSLYWPDIGRSQSERVGGDAERRRQPGWGNRAGGQGLTTEDSPSGVWRCHGWSEAAPGQQGRRR